MARIRLPWGRKARERRQQEAQQFQRQQAAEAFTRIVRLAETDWNQPTSLTPTAPLLTRGQARRTAQS